MAGRIRRSDIDELRQRVNIADIVGEYVNLKPAGVGSLRGLCPFHDERSPSFHVRPQAGFYHCFGCGEGGDVFSFVQKIDALSFSETVERLAERTGFTLTYEDGHAASEGAARTRLLQANKEAEAFFRERLHGPDASPGRTFLAERGFDQLASERFGLGFAPDSYDALSKHLTGKGFTVPELIQAGLVSQGDRGVFDRFRGRLIWPIRDVTGQTIGFGARRLRDDDRGPKYLNTPETALYHKSRVLYGLDLAKRAIAKEKTVVIVEGYTDVMACHLAGIETAVATCGTAFGADHIPVIRRVLGDTEGGLDQARGEIIFTFDPDEAGQKAASRAFQEQSKFAAQTFVAVPPEGLDPCDVRLHRGDEALRQVIANRKPMYEFMIRRVLDSATLSTVEGRTYGLRQAVEVVKTIKDPIIRQGYARELAGWLGMDPQMVLRELQRSSAAAQPSRNQGLVSPPTSDEGPLYSVSSLPRDPVTSMERDALMVLLQLPDHVPLERAASVLRGHFSHGALQVVRDALLAAFDHYGTPEWVAAVVTEAPETLTAFIQQLALLPVPDRLESVGRYAMGITASFLEKDLLRTKAELLSTLQRTDRETDPEAFHALQKKLVELENTRRQLKEDT